MRNEKPVRQQEYHAKQGTFLLKGRVSSLKETFRQTQESKGNEFVHASNPSCILDGGF